MPSYLVYKRQLSVLDADDIEWITVRGNHIPIKKGQSKEDAVKSFLESKGGSSKTESKPESSKSEKQGSLKEKMQKIIQRNGKVYGWETEGLEKFAENVEGKSIEQLKELHKAYKDRVAKLGMWVDTPTKLQEQFLGEIIEEQSKSESKTSNPNGIEGKSKPESKEFATKYLKRAMNGVGKEKWDKMSYTERTEAIKKEKDYYRTEGRNLYFDTEKGYGIRTDDPEFEKQFFEEYSDADKEDFKDYVKGFSSVGMTNEENSAKSKTKQETKKTENKQDESWGGSHPKFDKLTGKYMPDQGEADNELGEILRSINRVAYRYYNDGDRWNQGYGKETVNWAVNYLEKVSKKEGLPNEIANGLTDGVIMLKGSKSKNKHGYEQGIKMLIQTLEHASESDLESLAKMKRNK